MYNCSNDYEESEEEEPIYYTFDTENNVIKEYIVNKLLNFYIFNDKINSLIIRNYSDFIIFKEYFVINAEWIKNFLEVYNYKKISKLINKQLNGELKTEDLYKKIIKKKIHKLTGMTNEKINNLLWTVSFSPKEDSIPSYIYADTVNDDQIKFFNDFFIVDEEIYNELRQDQSIGYNFNIENKVNICLVDNLFIYKVYDNILGIGVLPEILDNTDISTFKVQILLIMDDENGYDLNIEIDELFRQKDLEKYLEYRKVFLPKNNLNSIIDMYNDKKKIGFLYNFGNFKLEQYWNRNHNKKKEKELEMIKLKELKEEEALKQIELEKEKKIELEKEQLKISGKNFLKNIMYDNERKEDNELLRIKFKKEKQEKNLRKEFDVLNLNITYKNINNNYRYKNDNSDERINSEEKNEKKLPNINNRDNIISNQNIKNINMITCSNFKITPIIKIKKNILRNTLSLPKIKKENILKTEKNESINIYAKAPLSVTKTNYSAKPKPNKEYNNLKTFSNNFGFNNIIMINESYNKSYSAKKNKIILKTDQKFKINEREEANDNYKETINKYLSKKEQQKFNSIKKSSEYKSSLKISMTINEKRSGQNNIFSNTQKSNKKQKKNINNNNNSPNKNKGKNKENNNNKIINNFKLKTTVLPRIINDHQKILEDFKKKMEEINKRIEEKRKKDEEEKREKAERRKKHEKEVYNKSIKLKKEGIELNRVKYEIKHGK